MDVARASRCTDSTRRHMHTHMRGARIIEIDARTSTQTLFYVTFFVRALAQASYGSWSWVVRGTPLTQIS